MFGFQPTPLNNSYNKPYCCCDNPIVWSASDPYYDTVQVECGLNFYSLDLLSLISNDVMHKQNVLEFAITDGDAPPGLSISGSTLSGYTDYNSAGSWLFTITASYKPEYCVDGGDVSLDFNYTTWCFKVAGYTSEVFEVAVDDNLVVDLSDYHSAVCNGCSVNFFSGNAYVASISGSTLTTVDMSAQSLGDEFSILVDVWNCCQDPNQAKNLIEIRIKVV